MRYAPILLFGLVMLGCTATDSRIAPGSSSNQIAETNLNLAIEYMRRGELETALEKLNRAEQADPNYYAVHNAFGLLYQRLNRPELAERHFRRALSLNNNDSMTRNNYGLFLCRRGRYQDAEDAFLEAVDNPLYETPAVAMTNAGTCARNNGEFEKAEQYLRRALEYSPRIPAALRQMAQISYQQEKYLSARGYLQRYLEVAPPGPDSLWLGVRIEHHLGDRDAESSYGLLLRNNYPDSEEADLYRSFRQGNR